ncbi:MAG: YtxH domain-containing protein [Acidimicrobiia bacterium]|nr:YtxH domain-containing protein [Acidimicrobiia bacterium]
MFWLLSRLVVWPVKAAAGTAKLGTKATAGSFKTGYRTGRLIGYRRVGVLALGVGIGLLVAPRPGRELREQVRQRLSERGLLSSGVPPVEPLAPWESPSPLPDVTAAATATAGATPDANGATSPVAADPGTAVGTEPGLGGVD